VRQLCQPQMALFSGCFPQRKGKGHRGRWHCCRLSERGYPSMRLCRQKREMT
jgi:hypothetical protein